MASPQPVSSLRRKITLGYVAISVLIMVLSALAFFELHQMETRIRAVSAITDFLNAILEMRRYEKNYFLYNNNSDWQANYHWLVQAEQIFQKQMLNLAVVVPNQHMLKQGLEHYRQAIGRQSGSWEIANAPLLEQEDKVRQEGKELVTTAEEMARTEKKHLFDALERHKKFFLVGIAVLALIVLAVGHILTKAVTAPLENMEHTLRRIAQGEIDHIHIHSQDMEIYSLTQAFNRMIMELRAQQKHMVRSEKLASLGTMLSGVAHEINNPLSNIATSCQILLEESVEEGFHRELLTQIDSQTLRARDIVRSLLDFARDRPFHHQAIPLRPLLEETLLLLRAQRSPGVTVTLETVEGVVVKADRQRLQQVLLNLVKNSLDALSSDGEIIISGHALEGLPNFAPDPHRLVAGNIDKCRVGSVVEIQIQDNGMGIDPLLLPRILDPFFTTKETGQGFGLGLFVVHEIIDEHGGCLIIDSQPGMGSTFRLYLPDPPLSLEETPL
ncbi:MAG: signal transduction histidine kinase [Magnetococcales bacterium]|nr:signal transduction histidine kinase [Magnetococcales bacterium]